MKERLKTFGAVVVTLFLVGLVIQVFFSTISVPCLLLCFDSEGHLTLTKAKTFPVAINITERNKPPIRDNVPRYELFWNSSGPVKADQGADNVNKGVPKLANFRDNYAKNKRQEKIQIAKKVPKIILLWNGPRFLSTSVRNCNVRNCIITKNRNLVNKSNVVVFFPRHLKFSEIPRKINGQVWVYFNMESPEYTYIRFNQWPNAFNWTATYRRDSDILLTYGHVVKREQSIKLNVTDVINRKSKMAAWFNSHCQTSSKREVYASLLMKSLATDVYGKCGKLKCSKNNKLCWSLLNTTYKFYLAFENSICRDYITEKSLKRLNEIILLIVRGGADYSLYLPPDSYLDTNDFKGPLELSKFAAMLGKNNSEYLKYHQWRDFYQTRQSIANKMYCDICKRLNNISKYKRVYYDIDKWWTGKGYLPFCTRGNGRT